MRLTVPIYFANRILLKRTNVEFTFDCFHEIKIIFIFNFLFNQSKLNLVFKEKHYVIAFESIID